MAGWWEEHRIRERAYALWESEGCPEGRDTEFWLRAEAEVQASQQEAEDEARLEHEGAV